MFGMCGKTAKYEEADIEGERKELKDLLDAGKNDIKQLPKVDVKNQLYQKMLFALLEPGYDINPVDDIQLNTQNKVAQQPSSAQQIINNVAQQQLDQSGSMFGNQQVPLAQSLGNDLDLDEPENDAQQYVNQQSVNNNQVEQQNVQQPTAVMAESQQQPSGGLTFPELQLGQVQQQQPIQSGLVFPELIIGQQQQKPIVQVNEQNTNVHQQQPIQSQIQGQENSHPQVVQTSEQTVHPHTQAIEKQTQYNQPIVQQQVSSNIFNKQPIQQNNTYTQNSSHQQNVLQQQIIPSTTSVQISKPPIQQQIQQSQQPQQHTQQQNIQYVNQNMVQQQSHPQIPTNQMIQSQQSQLAGSELASSNAQEVAYLKMQLDQQQQLFKQQMELMKAQQDKIVQQQKSDQETKQLIQELKQQMQQSNQYSPVLKNSGVHNYDQQQSPMKNSRLRRYQNAKLSLTSNSLCGFDGREKLFEINLGIPDVVRFEPSNKRIIISHSDGPIVIKAENEFDYNKWSQSIQNCISSARQGITSKGLVMKLDQQTQQLYVYKGEAVSPSKVFNIGNCLVEVRMDTNFATVKVKCTDGRKFSFGDKIPICEQWTMQFKRCGGTIQYL